MLKKVRDEWIKEDMTNDEFEQLCHEIISVKNQMIPRILGKEEYEKIIEARKANHKLYNHKLYP